MREPSQRPSRVAIVVASVGRPELVRHFIAALARQTVPPAQVVVSVPTLASYPSGIHIDPSLAVDVVVGHRGASAQRNAGVNALREDIDLIAFFDDDAVLRDDYLSAAVDAFSMQGNLVGLTGRVIVDGAAEGREVPLEEALSALDSSRSDGKHGREPTTDLYGCNIVVSRRVFLTDRFDERLKLYSWLEDLDLSRRIARRGSLARDADCVIAHLGSASGGRTQHVRLGYSQVTNPVYLWRKGSLSIMDVGRLVLRPLLSNLGGSFIGGSADWRRNRLRGNAMSFVDLLRGRVTPERIESIA